MYLVDLKGNWHGDAGWSENVANVEMSPSEGLIGELHSPLTFQLRSARTKLHAPSDREL